MRKLSYAVSAAAAVFLSFVNLSAATFVVPADRELVRRSHAIVIGAALSEYAAATAGGGIETITTFSIEKVIRGRFDTNSIDIHEPGGVLGDRAVTISGSPRLAMGQRVLLFLVKTGPHRWSIAELVLGKFRFTSDESGNDLLVRDEEEIAGWGPDLRPHREPRRSAARFLEFVQKEAAGSGASEDYYVASSALVPTISAARVIVPTATYTATSYTSIVTGTMGARWKQFPAAVTFYSSAAGEPGAPGNGSTAVVAALSSWTNDAGSNVNLTYGGTDSTHTTGLRGRDFANTVLFERDLSAWGAAPFTCSGSSYGGTLGIGGITSADASVEGRNTLNGEIFATVLEGDVEMNRGIANCSALFNSGEFNSGVAHEIGHALGFRHSDLNRNDSAACSSDPSLECSSAALMKASIPYGLNAALQSWDMNAVRTVYPGTACTAPAITSQPASSNVPNGGTTTLTIGATGTAPLSYQWYIGTTGDTAQLVGTSSSLFVSAGNYWVRVSNACGSVNSVTATVTESAPCMPPSITAQPQSTTVPPGGTTTLRVTATGTGTLAYQWYIGASGDTSRPVGTSSSLLVSAGSYWVRVSNTCGSVNSATATVTETTVSARRVRSDFDASGTADIFWRNASTGANALWLMSGFAFNGQNLPSMGTQYSVARVGDFNADGRADILWRNPSTGENVMWLMNGATVIASGTINSANPNYTLAAVGDFNGDGRSDILWRDPSNGANSMWLMNGMTVMAGETITQANASLVLAGTGDFNGDGRTDLLWRNPSNGFNSMWLMNGLSVMAGETITQANSALTLGGVGDFNGDGREDILWTQRSTGFNAIWFMNGFTTLAGETITPSDPSFNTVRVGDFNGDGRADILWRNDSNGANAIWMMNGFAIQSGSSISPANPPLRAMSP